METIKNIWKKINPRAVVIGGVLIVTTSFGTCQFTRVNLEGTIDGQTPPIPAEVEESIGETPVVEVQANDEEEEVSGVE